MIGPGTTVGPYRAVARLGRGAVGEVWRAQIDGVAFPVALKVVGVAERALRTALLTEVRAASRLDHPNVLPILDFGELPALDGFSGPAAYVVTELCSGTLRDAYRPERGAPPWSEARRLIVDLLRGLAHAHARGIVHRDLKPQNVLFRQTATGRSWRIADLGIALLGRTLDARPSSGSTGTPLYMAPEQVDGRWRDQGPWTDLYALGCLVHELAGGRHPLAGLGGAEVLARQRSADLPPLATAIDDAPPGLAGWVARLLHGEVRQRYTRAADALADLLALDDAPAPPLEARPRPEVPSVGLPLVPLRRPTFVGRSAARAALRGLAERPGLAVAVISGRSGSGKSELARSVCEELHETGARSVLWATWSQGEGPHDGLAAMIEREVHGRGLATDELSARLGARIPAADVPDVTGLLRPDAERGVRLTTAEERFRAVRRFLAAEAAGRPVVLWLDDVQWGAEGLAFLHWLHEARAAGAGSEPVGDVLVLATVREEGLPSRPAEAALLDGLPGEPLRVRVDALEPSEIEALARSLVDLSPRASAALVERAAGNALFAVQLVTDWAARGLLSPGADGFEVAADARWPEDVVSSWTSRIADALGEVDRRALEVAAVLGMRIVAGEWVAACAAAGITERDPVEELALRAGLLVREPSGDVVFVHGMLREVLLVEARAAGRLPALARACADAVIGSGDHLRIGRFLAAGPDPREALLHLRRGAIVLGQHGRSGEVAGVLAEHEAVRPADDLRSLAELQVIEARFRLGRGEVDRAEQVALAAAAAAERFGWDDVLGDTGCALCTIHRSRGRRQLAHEAATEARARFDRLGDPIGVARATALLADLTDDRTAALALAETALALVRGRGVDGGALYAGLLLRLGNGHRLMGDLAAAEAAYEAARDEYVRLGDRASLGQVVSALGSIRLDRGDTAAARALVDEALALLLRAEQPRAISIVETFAAEVAVIEGDFARAEAYARAASERLHQSGIRNRFSAELVLAALRMLLGRAAEAQALVDRVRRLAGAELPLELGHGMDLVELSLVEDREAYEERLARLVGSARRTRYSDFLLDHGRARAKARGW